ARKLTRNGGEVGQLLAAALGPYFASVTENAGGLAEIPDAAAAMYAMQPDLCTPTVALLAVMTERNLTRGQTNLGTTPGIKTTIIASEAELSGPVDRLFSEPGFDLQGALIQILMRHPDNAKVVLDIRGEQMARMLQQDLTHR